MCSFILGLFVCLMVLNATFNNISAMSWQTVLLVEETSMTTLDFVYPTGSYLGINFMGDSTMEADDTLENVYEEEDKREEEKQFTDMMENNFQSSYQNLAIFPI
jgi:hypothetical protein